ncbi:uncharacterized protein GLRG_07359 [Colletotrichum graminicola M1.001]|uniref:Uncharacterized protein n=1 Tax=Colletotrichum graminicola (strain M1.001 / M2 / FGSC 10212) TaxID=645133 RepID=E3QMX7_COLGM|nr:uncharacterized protein GLRG_07359 [Colletotrichum graminicola M1.001]EFQ32215.1 hypothetical protein GLRG_07359 [Colletotrichum graminicola M1.001]
MQPNHRPPQKLLPWSWEAGFSGRTLQAALPCAALCGAAYLTASSSSDQRTEPRTPSASARQDKARQRPVSRTGKGGRQTDRPQHETRQTLLCEGLWLLPGPGSEVMGMSMEK